MVLHHFYQNSFNSLVFKLRTKITKLITKIRHPLKTKLRTLLSCDLFIGIYAYQNSPKEIYLPLYYEMMVKPKVKYRNKQCIILIVMKYILVMSVVYSYKPCILWPLLSEDRYSYFVTNPSNQYSRTFILHKWNIKGFCDDICFIKSKIYRFCASKGT